MPLRSDLAGVSQIKDRIFIVILYPLMMIPFLRIRFISSTNRSRKSFAGFGFPSPYQIAIMNGFKPLLCMLASIGQNSFLALLNNGIPSILKFKLKHMFSSSD